jgi:transposase
MRTPGHPFFDRQDGVLSDHDCDRKVEALCGAYDADRDGRPSIPPGVDFRMVMVSSCEKISSECGLAWRSQDSLSLRSFLGLGPAQAASDHSSLSVILRSLPIEVFRAVQKLVLEMLRGSGLLLGRALAIDAWTMEANAAMRPVVRRDRNDS